MNQEFWFPVPWVRTDEPVGDRDRTAVPDVRRSQRLLGGEMNLKLLFSIAAMAFLAQSSAQATPIQYQGNIAVNGSAVTGFVSGFGWISDDAPNVDFWTFSGVAGESVLIRGTRLQFQLDPALTLYRGATTADNSAFVHDGSFGGITFLGIGDDELAPPGNRGPFGDPLLLIELPATGVYTIAFGGSDSDADPVGGLPYRLSVSVPAPGTIPLFAIALVGLGWTLRRKHIGRSGGIGPRI